MEDVQENHFKIILNDYVWKEWPGEYWDPRDLT
jgi:hypothetical protein